MEQFTTAYENFVRLTSEYVLKANSKNIVTESAANSEIDQLVFSKAWTTLKAHDNTLDGEPTEEQFNKVLKLVDCQDLSFVEECLFGNLKSVLNLMIKQSPTDAELYRSSSRTILSVFNTRSKMVEILSKTKEETKRIEEDLQIGLKIIDSITSTEPMSKDELTICINNVIKLIDKLWTDEDYCFKILNVMCPSVIQRDEDRLRIKNIISSLCMTPDNLNNLLDHIINWKTPANITRRPDVVEVVKIIFRRSSVLRAWKKNKATSDVGSRIRLISILINGFMDYIMKNIECVKKICGAFAQVCSDKYTMKDKIDSADECKAFIMKVLNMLQTISKTIRSENKKTLIRFIDDAFTTLEQGMNLTSIFESICEQTDIVTKDALLEYLDEVFPLELREEGEPSLFDLWVDVYVNSDPIPFVPI